MKERAARCILVLIVLLLALCLFGRADVPPPASSEGLSGSQEIMSRIIGDESYTIREGYDSNVLIQTTTIDRMNERNTRVLMTCTGMLISETEETRQRTTVIVGAYFLDLRGTEDIEVEVAVPEGGVPAETIRRHVLSFWVPSKYKGNPDEIGGSHHRHDYCVLRLQRSISPSKVVPTPLAAETMTEVPIGTRGVILGWGIQEPGNAWPVKQLRGLNITTTSCRFPGSSFQEEMWPPTILPENKPRSIFICAMRLVGEGGTCPGDSGGPLIIDGSIRGVAVSLIRENPAVDCTDRQLNMDIWLDIAAPPVAGELRNRLILAPLGG